MVSPLKFEAAGAGFLTERIVEKMSGQRAKPPSNSGTTVKHRERGTMRDAQRATRK